MKRYLYLFPLMAVTAATLALGACDDNKAEEQAAADQTMVAPETVTTDTAMTQSPATTTGVPAAVVHTMDGKSFATAPGTTTGVAFVTLHNPGIDADKLVGATTSVAASVEMHETSMDSSGTMQMRKVDSIDLPGGQQVTMTPNGYHLMLMGLTAPLTEGQMFPVTLDFEKAPDAVVNVTVTAAGAPATIAPMDSTLTTTTPETMTPPAESTMPTEMTPTDETMPDATGTDATSSAEPMTDTADEAPVEPTVQ